MQNKDETFKYFLTEMAKKYEKNQFEFEEAKRFCIEESRLTKEDFDQCWQKAYTINEEAYVRRIKNDTFVLLYKTLRYLPSKKERERWTHSELIALGTSIASIIIAILGVIF